MKKTLAHVAALFLSVVMMSGAAISASARTDIVISTDDTGFILSNYVKVSYDKFKQYSKTDYMPQYGDIIEADTVKGELMIVETFPGLYEAAKDDELVFNYLGNVKDSDDYTCKEMTVTVVDESNITLEDADGVIYKYSFINSLLEGYFVPEGMSKEDYQVGDVLTAVTYTVSGGGNTVYALPLTPAPERTPIKGDVDGDGAVDIMDVILLNRHLMIGAELSEQGMQNALTCAGDSSAARSAGTERLPDAVDSLNILKYVVGLIDAL